MLLIEVKYPNYMIAENLKVYPVLFHIEPERILQNNLNGITIKYISLLRNIIYSQTIFLYKIIIIL